MIVDAVREVRPPFSPSAVVDDFAVLLKSYRVSKVIGDHYGGEFERRVSRAGRDSIDHAPGAHDDIANAVSGVVGAIASGVGRMNLIWDNS